MDQRRHRHHAIEVNTAAYLLERGELDDDVPSADPSDRSEEPPDRDRSRPDSTEAESTDRP